MLGEEAPGPKSVFAFLKPEDRKRIESAKTAAAPPPAKPAAPQPPAPGLYAFRCV